MTGATGAVDVRRSASVGGATRLTVRAGSRVLLACEVDPAVDVDDLADLLRAYLMRGAGRFEAAPLSPPPGAMRLVR